MNIDLPGHQKYRVLSAGLSCSHGETRRRYWLEQRSNTLPQHSYPRPEHGANGLLIQSVSCAVKSWAAVGWALQTAQGHYRPIVGPVPPLIASSESWTNCWRTRSCPWFTISSPYWKVSTKQQPNGTPTWPRWVQMQRGESTAFKSASLIISHMTSVTSHRF